MIKDLSIKPYLIRAVYEWCIANNATPHLTALSSSCQNLPVDLSNSEDITLNIGLTAVSDLLMNNELIQFNTRFNGFVKKVTIPVEAIRSIFSKESGDGLSFFPEITNSSGISMIEAENSKKQVADGIKGSENDIKFNRDKSFLKIVK